MSSKSLRVIWPKLVFAGLFFCCIKILLSAVILSSFAKVIIDAEFDHEDTISVFYAFDSTFSKDHVFESKAYRPGKRTSEAIELKNRISRKLRLDIGSHPGSAKIYGMNIISHFSKPSYYSPEQIYDLFQPNADISSFSLENNYLRISVSGNDPYLISKHRIANHSVFFEYLLPLLLSYIFFLFLQATNFSKLPVIEDLAHKTSSTGNNISALDGVRGVAALAVLAEHTGVGRGIGSMGVYLFFALSGFLLATPFVIKPENALSYSYMTHYLVRRIKRIIPMYYTFITITMLFRGEIPDSLRHYFFLQGDSHLWTIPQEMFFYILLPCIVILLCFLSRINKLLNLIFLGSLVYIVNIYLTTHIISFYGYGTSIKPMVGIFIGGILFSYCYFYFRQSSFASIQNSKLFNIFLSIIGTSFFTAFILLTTRSIPQLKYFNALTYPGSFGLLAGLCVFSTAISEDALHTKILQSTFLRAIGLIGFSYYLLHPLALTLFKTICHNYIHIAPGAYITFLVVGVVTYFLAAFTYTYIERPFLKKTAQPEVQSVIPA